MYHVPSAYRLNGRICFSRLSCSRPLAGPRLVQARRSLTTLAWRHGIPSQQSASRPAGCDPPVDQAQYGDSNVHTCARARPLAEGAPARPRGLPPQSVGRSGCRWSRRKGCRLYGRLSATTCADLGSIHIFTEHLDLWGHLGRRNALEAPVYRPQIRLLHCCVARFIFVTKKSFVTKIRTASEKCNKRFQAAGGSDSITHSLRAVRSCKTVSWHMHVHSAARSPGFVVDGLWTCRYAMPTHRTHI